jgi:transcriptional regulator with XRE-family HTH domain
MIKKQYTEDSLVAKVGKRIRALRTEQGVSLREFGKQAGLHPFHVMAIELGQLAANTKTLRAIAKQLGVAPIDLLNHDVEGNDIGFLLELMRTNPECIPLVKKAAKQ